jgi:hypothetical protein
MSIRAVRGLAALNPFGKTTCTSSAWRDHNAKRRPLNQRQAHLGVGGAHDVDVDVDLALTRKTATTQELLALALARRLAAAYHPSLGHAPAPATRIRTRRSSGTTAGGLDSECGF